MYILHKPVIRCSGLHFAICLLCSYYNKINPYSFLSQHARNSASKLKCFFSHFQWITVGLTPSFNFFLEVGEISLHFRSHSHNRKWKKTLPSTLRFPSIPPAQVSTHNLYLVVFTGQTNSGKLPNEERNINLPGVPTCGVPTCLNYCIQNYKIRLHPSVL